jgi:2-aminoadipate transaminase
MFWNYRPEATQLKHDGMLPEVMSVSEGAGKSGSSEGVVTFDEAPEAGVVNFGVGQPSADLLPVELVHRASERYFESAVPQDLNYGGKQGDPRFRAALSSLLGREYGKAAPPESLFLTAGNSQALDFLCSRFAKPGDTVFVEEPSYFLAFQILRDHGLKVVGVPMDEEGLDVEQLERMLPRHRPRLLYTIPSYHNPTGRTLGRERRERLVELSHSHGFAIAADEVYQMLWYREPPPPALGTWAAEGNVLSLGSFSKILAPGMRLGWIQTSDEYMRTLLASGVVNSGGSFNHYTSHLVRHAIEAGLLEDFILRLRERYRSRVETMHRVLHEHLAEFATWQRPEGGYFFWLELAKGVDATRLRERAAEFHTGFQPGAVFAPDGQGLDHFLRLSFAHYGEADIEEGIARLAALLRDAGCTRLVNRES